MVFPSVEFAVFFPPVLIVSWLLMSRPVPWKLFLLAASAVFYLAASPIYALLLAGVVVLNQTGATLVDRTEDRRVRRRIVAATVAVDLGILGVFKYYGFFVEDVGRVLDDVGLTISPPLLNLALPVGLSFFTFQAISYVVDVHRGLCE